MTKTLADFYNLFDALNDGLTFFGLSALGRNMNQPYYRLSLKKVGWCVIIMLLIVYAFYEQITRFFPHDSNLVHIILYYYLTIVGTFMALFMVITAITNASDLSQVLHCEYFFELFLLDQNYRPIKVLGIIFCIYALSVLIACYISDWMAAAESELMVAIQTLLFFLFPLYNSFCLNQFFIIHYWLKRVYWNINCSLEHLNNQEVEQKNGIVFVKPGNKLNDHRNFPEEIVRLRRLNHKAYLITKRINKMHATRNILLFAHHIALEIINFYWGLRHILEDINVPLTRVLNFYKAAFMSIVSVITMIWPCATTRNEANRTISLVHDLISSTKDDDAIFEVYSLMLQQEKFRFSPHNLFDMNNQLILSILALMTSYLIILLQYHMMNIELTGLRSATNNESAIALV